MDMESWEEPSEQVLEQRRKMRERSNKISKIMGQYLLQGYRMLGTTCNKCAAILMQDRQGVDYCIGCSEVDAPEQDTLFTAPTPVVNYTATPTNIASASADTSTNTPSPPACQDQRIQAAPKMASVASFIAGPDQADFQQQQQQAQTSQQQQTATPQTTTSQTTTTPQLHVDVQFVPRDVLEHSKRNLLSIVRRLNDQMDEGHAPVHQLEALEKCYSTLAQMQAIHSSTL